MSSLLLDLALKSLAIAAFGLGVTALMRRSSAATRHLVLTLTLAGLLILPVIELAVPRWQVPFLKVTVAAPAAVVTTAPAATVSAPVENDKTNPSLPLAAILWCSVGLLCASRIWFRLARLRRMERHLDMSGDPVLHGIVTDHCRRSRRHVLLLEGAPHEPPMTWGHFRPVLLLPSDASSWQSGRLHSVVLHELAHVERGDWLASIVSQVACAAYWFNPFVWAISARMSRESESAADDRVLGQGYSAAQYATHLLEVLRDLRGSKSSAASALAMARPGSLDGRVRAILEERRCRRPARGMAAMGLVASIATFVAVIAAAGPSIVQETSPMIGQIGPFVSMESKSNRTTHETVKKVVVNPPAKKHGSKISNPVPKTRSEICEPNQAVVALRAPGTSSVLVSGGSVSSSNSTSTASVGSGGGVSVQIDKDFEDGMREAQEEVKKSLAEAKKQIEEARKSGASDADLKMASDAMEMGNQLATNAVKSVQPIIKKALNEGLKKGLEDAGKALKNKPPKPPKS